jgi:hypothetical protein
MSGEEKIEIAALCFAFWKKDKEKAKIYSLLCLDTKKQKSSDYIIY